MDIDADKSQVGMLLKHKNVMYEAHKGKELSLVKKKRILTKRVNRMVTEISLKLIQQQKAITYNNRCND